MEKLPAIHPESCQYRKDQKVRLSFQKLASLLFLCPTRFVRLGDQSLSPPRHFDVCSRCPLSLLTYTAKHIAATATAL